jgi:hypothetical protein
MSEPKPISRGEQIPHFEVSTVDGGAFSYATVWQQKNLLLVALGGSASDEQYASELRRRQQDFDRLATACVITRDPVPGLHGSGVVIADRWGEIIHVSAASDAAPLPPAEELLDWLEYLQHRCPECEGEVK